MKKKQVISILVIVALFLVLGASAVSAKYVAGTSAGFPPFEYIEDGKIVGFDIDLVYAIADLMGFEVEFIDISFDSLIPALNARNIDLIAAGMTITEQRGMVVDFSVPYYSADQAVLVAEKSDFDVTVLFGDGRIGVQTGTTGDLWVEENLVNTGIFTGRVVHYETFIYAIQDLLIGNTHAVVLDAPVAHSYAQARPAKVVAELITGEEYGIAVRKGNTELLEKINEGIRLVWETGIMDELLLKYFD